MRLGPGFCVPSPPKSLRSRDFSLYKAGEVEEEKERSTLRGKRTCPLRPEGGRLGSVRDAPAPRLALARWLPKAPGRSVRANLGRSKTPQNSSRRPQPSRAPGDPTPGPARALQQQRRQRVDRRVWGSNRLPLGAAPFGCRRPQALRRDRRSQPGSAGESRSLSTSARASASGRPHA